MKDITQNIRSKATNDFESSSKSFYRNINMYGRTLRRNQREIAYVVRNNNRCLIKSCTGSGKTLSILDTALENIKNTSKPSVIATRSMLLTEQITGELIDSAIVNRLQIILLYSGKYDKVFEDEQNDDVKSNDRSLYEEAIKSQKYFKESRSHKGGTIITIPTTDLSHIDFSIPTIVIATYNSFPLMIEKTKDIGVVILDEAHTYTSDAANDVLNSVNGSTKMFLFTATPKGQRKNIEKFTDSQYYVYSYKNALDDDIVSPISINVIHNLSEDEIATAIYAVEDDIKNHDISRHVVKFGTIRKAYDLFFALIRKIELKQMKPEFDIYICTSEYFYKFDKNTTVTVRDGNKHNMYRYADCYENLGSKEAILKDMRENEGNYVVCSVHMLTVGIDVPGLTTGTLLRSGNIQNNIQFIGRFVRKAKNKKIGRIYFSLNDEEMNKSYIESIKGIAEHYGVEAYIDQIHSTIEDICEDRSKFFPEYDQSELDDIINGHDGESYDSNDVPTIEKGLECDNIEDLNTEFDSREQVGLFGERSSDDSPLIKRMLINEYLYESTEDALSKLSELFC